MGAVATVSLECDRCHNKFDTTDAEIVGLRDVNKIFHKSCWAPLEQAANELFLIFGVSNRSAYYTYAQLVEYFKSVGPTKIVW